MKNIETVSILTKETIKNGWLVKMRDGNFKAGSMSFWLHWSWSQKIEENGEEEEEDDDDEEEKSTGRMYIALYNRGMGPLWFISSKWNRHKENSASYTSYGPMTIDSDDLRFAFDDSGIKSWTQEIGVGQKIVWEWKKTQPT
jgi:hypothetical protein